MFNINRLATGFALACTMAAAPAIADTYPSKPIRLIVNSSPGGLTDVTARLVANQMAKSMGQSIVVENRSGAAVVGADAVAKAAPDGYTVGVLGNSLSALPSTNSNMPFDPQKDLIPIALLTSSPLILVTGPNSPYHSVNDYIKDAKARPGQVTFASGGNVTMGHLLAEQLQGAAGIELIHVPYRGGAPAMVDVLAGHVPVMFDTVATTTPLAKDGKVRPLAVVSPTRVDALPQVPTLTEAGFSSVQGHGWFGMFAPAGTPPAIIAKLNAEAQRALQDPEVKERLASLGTQPEGGSAQRLNDLLSTEISRWSKLVKERNLQTN